MTQSEIFKLTLFPPAAAEHHRLYLFGNNRDNHLGLQSPFEKSYNVPIPVPFDEHLSYLQVALGEDHRVALTSILSGDNYKTSLILMN